MYRCSHRILRDEREVRLKFKGEFDGLQAFEYIHDTVSSNGTFDRIVLDFSESSRVKPVELHYLIADLADDPCFNKVEIRIQGLRFNYMDSECPTHKGNFGTQDSREFFALNSDMLKKAAR